MPKFHLPVRLGPDRVWAAGWRLSLLPEQPPEKVWFAQYEHGGWLGPDRQSRYSCVKNLSHRVVSENLIRGTIIRISSKSNGDF